MNIILKYLTGFVSSIGLLQCSQAHYYWKDIHLSSEDKQNYEFGLSTPYRKYIIRYRDGIQTLNMETHWVSDPVKKSYRFILPDQKLNNLIYQFVEIGQFCYQDSNEFLRAEGITAGAWWDCKGTLISWNLVWPEVQKRLQMKYNELNLYLFQITPQWHQYPEAFPFISSDAPPHVTPQERRWPISE